MKNNCEVEPLLVKTYRCNQNQIQGQVEKIGTYQ